MNVPESLEKLKCQLDDGLDGEDASASFDNVQQAPSEKVHGDEIALAPLTGFPPIHWFGIVEGLEDVLLGQLCMLSRGELN